MIVLDTNVLPVRGELLNPVMSAVLRTAEARGIPVCLPSIVIDESVNLRVKAAAEASKRLRDAISAAAKLFEVDPIYIADADDVGAQWRLELSESFTVLEIAGDDATEALRREALRIPPAREGRGGRDAAIWLTALRGPDSLQADPVVHFVSSNTADFAAGNALLPELQSEAASRSIDLTFCANLDAVLAALSTPFTYTPTEEDADQLTEQLPELLNDYEAANDGEKAWLSTAIASISELRVKRALTTGDVWLALLVVDVSTEQTDVVFGDSRELPQRVRIWSELESEHGPISSVTVERVNNLSAPD